MTRNIGGQLTLEALKKLHCPAPRGRTMVPRGDKVARCDFVSSSDVLQLLDRARYDVERGWLAAALDATSRAVQILQRHTTRSNP